MNDWTPQRVELLRKYVTEGLSSAQAAKRINVETQSTFTRNAIIGKVIRLGLSRPSVAKASEPRIPRLLRPSPRPRLPTREPDGREALQRSREITPQVRGGMSALWETEAAMVADFSAWAEHCGWVVYHETAGWDLLLVRPEDGFQIGIEAKLSLNAHVLCQVLDKEGAWRSAGPDCLAILAPRPKTVNGIEKIARHLDIVVITGAEPDRRLWRPKPWSGPVFAPDLPKSDDRFTNRERSAWGNWPERCPDQRCKLPEYVPDVSGGKPAPVTLTAWKVQAIKAAIILEVRGWLTRKDIKALNMDPSRWTQFWLASIGDGRWAPTSQLPDFKAQHPVNYEQIKADMPNWLPATIKLEGVAA